MLVLAKSHEESSNHEQASRVIESAHALAARFPPASHALARLLLQLNINYGSLGKLKITDPCLAARQAICEIRSKQKHSAQVRSKRLSEIAASLFALRGVGNETDMSLPNWDDTRDRATRASALDVLVELGYAALLEGEDDLASKCAKHVAAATDAGVAALAARGLGCAITVHQLDSKGGVFARSSIRSRLDTLDEMRQLIRSVQTLSHPALLQQLCASVWSMCQPLLQVCRCMWLSFSLHQSRVCFTAQPATHHHAGPRGCSLRSQFV
jgi:hypothetical protein